MSQPVALVTGANRGLGLETCRSLARKGYHVFLTARSAAKAAKAAELLAKQGLSVEPLALDVTDPARLEVARAKVEKSRGRLDALVNNAGIMLKEDDWQGSLLDLSLDVLRRTWETNVAGVLAACRAFVPLMKKTGHGRVVNVSSEAGRLDGMGAGAGAYKSSKSALNALTLVLAAELKGTDILVNSVCPGWCRTDMGGAGAPRSVEQGAESIVWAATLPADGPTGGFFQDGKPLPW